MKLHCIYVAGINKTSLNIKYNCDCIKKLRSSNIFVDTRDIIFLLRISSLHLCLRFILLLPKCLNHIIVSSSSSWISDNSDQIMIMNINDDGEDV